MKVVHDIYDKVISVENILACWYEFKKGKANKSDVMSFERYLEDNIFLLHEELKSKMYKHAPYDTFYIYDPKYRVISKATVKDRLVHHIVFNDLYRIFDPTFIYHSYASRLHRGTHLAVKNVARSLRKVSKNYNQQAYALKCDIKKFFDSVDHQKLLQLIQKRVSDSQLLWLIQKVIESFSMPASNSAERERELEVCQLGM